MTWRGEISANSINGQFGRGSYTPPRGASAEFLVRTDDLEFGRRTETHEYPQRDLPYVEDLGRKARRFQIEVFVAGLNYLADRDALIAAIEVPGSGILTHPYYGIMNVTVVEARVRQSNREGGTATFTLTCIESGELTFPTVQADTAVTTDAAADVASDSLLTRFAKRFSIEGLTGWSVTALEDEVSRTVSGITQVVGNVANTIAAEIRAPYNMAQLVIGNIQKIRSLASIPGDALRLYRSLFGAGSDSPSVPTTTATRRQQASDADALHELVRTSAVIEACRTVSQMDFTAADDALAVRDELLDALDERMDATDPVTGAPIDEELFTALRALRVAMVEDLRVRGAKLPRITYTTPTATLPATVLAYRIYGDASRADEIVTRNKIRHPGFVPGGTALEVLSDG